MEGSRVRVYTCSANERCECYRTDPRRHCLSDFNKRFGRRPYGRNSFTLKTEAACFSQTAVSACALQNAQTQKALEL